MASIPVMSYLITTDYDFGIKDTVYSIARSIQEIVQPHDEAEEIIDDIVVPDVVDDPI